GFCTTSFFQQITEMDRRYLYIFSQEMLLGWMISKRDPYVCATTEELLAFGSGHPALEALVAGHFDWPQVPDLILRRGDGGDPNGPVVEQSPLRRLGYAVGTHGV